MTEHKPSDDATDQEDDGQRTDLSIEITGINTAQLDAIESEMPESATVVNDLDEMLYRKFAEGFQVEFDDVTVERTDR